MTQILQGHFDGSRARRHAQPVSPELSSRHNIDGNGRRVLAGLTSAETQEFETLDSLPPSDSSGNVVAWTFGGAPTTGPEKRWLQLYTKHDEAWNSLQNQNGREHPVPRQFKPR